MPLKNLFLAGHVALASPTPDSQQIQYTLLIGTSHHLRLYLDLS